MLKRLRFAIILIILTLVAARPVTAQVRVTQITSPDMLSGKKGIVYTLPRTIIDVDLWITKTQQFPGPLAQFARDYIGLDNVITKSVVSYSIDKTGLRASTEPDPGRIYLIEKEEKISGQIWISFGKPAPVLTIEKFDKTPAPEGFTSWNENLFVTPDAEHLFRKYTESPTRLVIDTIIRKVSIDTMVIEQKIFKRSMVEFTDEEKAQEAAEQIRKIEQDKYNLLIGYQETAYSRETLEFMCSQLDAQKREYLKLFTGVSVTENLKFDYQVIPEADNEDQKYSVAGFSKSNGLVAPEGQNEISVSLKSDAGNISFVPDANLAYTGLVYRVPRTVEAVLSFQGKELASQRMEVLQLGSVLALPLEFKKVEFDAVTGELRSVVIE